MASCTTNPIATSSETLTTQPLVLLDQAPGSSSCSWCGSQYLGSRPFHFLVGGSSGGEGELTWKWVCDLGQALPLSALGRLVPRAKSRGLEGMGLTWVWLRPVSPPRGKLII